jgi:hypothetical protein
VTILSLHGGNSGVPHKQGFLVNMNLKHLTIFGLILNNQYSVSLNP